MSRPAFKLLLFWISSCRAFTSKIAIATRRQPAVSILSTIPFQAEDESTVVSLTSPTGQTVTLIGTAHLSEKSNDQVQRLIEAIQPNVVMVETDPSRLERIGIPSMQDIRVARITTCQDIELPLPQLSRPAKPWLLEAIQTIVVKSFTKIARALLTNLYKDLGAQMNARGGGEFLRAIRSAENCTACDTVVLGDRSSLVTLQRAAELALESGNAWGVLAKLQAVNEAEMNRLEDKVRKDLVERYGQEVEEGKVTVAIMEELKKDAEFRNRLFLKLEQEVPEFTRAFLKERDYLMSESIRRELERPQVQKVVGVVGLAHVPGMANHFKMVFANQPAPLIQELAAVDYMH